VVGEVGEGSERGNKTAYRTAVETTDQASEKPIILVVDGEGPSSVTAAALQDRYGRSYEITVVETTAIARSVLDHAANGGVEVALVLAQRLADVDDVLDAARRVHPHARRGFLLQWHEIRAEREDIAAAFVRRQVECFVTKPAGDPDERFHRSITELLDEWWRIHGTKVTGIRIVGAARSSRISEISDLLQRHDFRYTFYELGTEAATALLGECGLTGEELPVLVLEDGQILENPTNVEVAVALGARDRPAPGVYDVAVIGGGPAGLSAAVYAESEGLRTVLIEPTALGGQAGTSSMIRNFFGFPRGISGAELATRAFEQAILFGTAVVYGSAAVTLRLEDGLRKVALSNGTEVQARAVVVATGVSYRRMEMPTLEAFDGIGVHYGAATSEAPSLRDAEVFVVGGGNSAGQAAVYLAKFARKVTITVRGASLASSMSRYLITEIDGTRNIDVRYRTEVVDVGGEDHLECVVLQHGDSDVIETCAAQGLFILIGGDPFTEWLPPEVKRDEWGYILTGPEAGGGECLPYESTMPGVFAVGDVRRTSVKRVASAVGEGAVCVRLLHEHLARPNESA
jgi:thioredoxin reductase (NADPH)